MRSLFRGLGMASGLVMAACGSDLPGTETTDRAPNAPVSQDAQLNLTNSKVLTKLPTDPAAARASAARFARKAGQFDRVVVARMRLSPEKEAGLLDILTDFRLARERLANELAEHPETDPEEIDSRPEFADGDVVTRNGRIKRILTEEEFGAYIDLIDSRRAWLPDLKAISVAQDSEDHAGKNVPATIDPGAVR